MTDSLADIVNEERIKSQIYNILLQIKALENHDIRGDITQYLGYIYTSMVVLEDFFPDLYSRCKTEVGVDYKKLALYLRKLNPSLTPEQRKLMAIVINKAIEDVLKRIPEFKAFILKYFERYSK